MLNGIFVFLVLASLLLAAWSGRMDALNQAILDSAQDAVFKVALRRCFVPTAMITPRRTAALRRPVKHRERAAVSLQNNLRAIAVLT